ncbi:MULTISPECIES: hypothetical protein [Bacillaceae]|uniref:hypothetical protein n=1 Tax=Bacillaceae TaxID=186817 RepID=UPI000E73B044|nr:hypothetical protein [Bacillus sp. PK3_68]RJS60351.1 hypothetical protein CJ483_09930 [Bacillus sp. PK3_68]
MKIREFLTNPYIIAVLGVWFSTSFIIIFYMNWTFAGVALLGTFCFFLYISAVYRFVLYKGAPWFERREDDLFMSLWYAWPVYVLASLTIFLLSDELWALAFAAGGAAGILVGEFRHVSLAEKGEKEPMKVQVQ